MKARSIHAAKRLTDGVVVDRLKPIQLSRKTAFPDENPNQTFYEGQFPCWPMMGTVT
jgi:hypothetical protein